jgi:hypothetical protein
LHAPLLRPEDQQFHNPIHTPPQVADDKIHKVGIRPDQDSLFVPFNPANDHPGRPLGGRKSLPALPLGQYVLDRAVLPALGVLGYFGRYPAG